MPGARKCLVVGCSCNEDSKSSTEKLHSFPISPTLRTAWLRLLGLGESNVTTTSRVCSRHFEGGTKTTENKLPIVDIGKSEEEKRKIIASYCHQVIMKSKRPIENIIDDAVVLLENDDEYNAMKIGAIIKVAKEEAGFTMPNIEVTIGPDGETDEVGTSGLQAMAEPGEIVEEADQRGTEQAAAFEGFRTPPLREKRKSGFGTPQAIVEPRKRIDQRPSPDHQNFGFLSSRKRVTKSTAVQTDSTEYKISKATMVDMDKEGKDQRVTPSRFQIDDLTDEQFRLFSGTKRQFFDVIFKHVRDAARLAIYWRGPKNAQRHSKSGNIAFFVSLDDADIDEIDLDEDSAQRPSNKTDDDLRAEFYMTLMKLRTNISFALIGFLFGWSTGKISSVFHTWLDILHRYLKSLVVFPNQTTCWATMPRRIRDQFPYLRCIVDCTEIAIERPQRPYLQAVTFSQYKKKNTIKILVAILPNGCIGFISKAYTGRASDRFLMDHSGIMNLLERGDTVLADRGFSITDELLVRGIALNAPPGATGRIQFTSEEVRRGATIAKVRIFVEQAIGRMKVFKILQDTLPIAFVPLADKMMITIAGVCNLLPPLVK